MQLTGTAQVEASTPDSIPGSFQGSSFPSNNSVSSQVSVQTHILSFASKWESCPRTTGPEGSSPSATSAPGNVPQVKSSQAQTHISFGYSLASTASFQGQHIVIKGEPESSSMAGLNSSSDVSRAALLPSQETSPAPDGPSQKSSATCRRNVPSILTTCPSQLSELKY